MQAIEGFRLSPQQQRVWRLQQQAETAVFHASCAVVVKGDLDLAALRAALETVVAHHEILRTTYAALPGLSLPLQVIATVGAPSLEMMSDTLADTAAAIGDRLREVAAPSFVLASGPLLRAACWRLPGTDYLVVLSSPALSNDRLGLRNVVSEIGRAYAAARAGGELPEPPCQYADIAEALNGLSEEAGGEAGVEFWRCQDLGSLLGAKLAGSTGDAPPGAFRPAAARFTVPPALAAVAKGAAAQLGVPASTFALACWAALLHRLTGLPRLMVGVAADGRSAAELGTVPGLFTRHLPVVIDLGGTSGFAALSRTLERHWGECLDWQDYFSWGSSEGTFPFAFEWVAPPESLAGGELALDIVREDFRSGGCRLELLLTPAGAGWEGEIRYDAAATSAAQAETLAGRWLTVLASAAKSPAGRLDELEVLAPGERQQLVVELNATGLDNPRADVLPRLFERQVAATPERVALVSEERRLTYAELDALADRVAASLRALGITAEKRVALCVERSVEMMAALLGILKVGVAYVPLDPEYPTPRLSHILEDCRPLCCSPGLISPSVFLASRAPPCRSMRRCPRNVRNPPWAPAAFPASTALPM